MTTEPTTNSSKKPWTHSLWPTQWRPLLDFWLDIGLLQIETAVWRELIHADAIDYMTLQVRVLRKWGFRFRLYDTGMRRYIR